MSHCLRAMVAANNAVSAPTPATTALETGASANKRLQRATRYTPAVTMVAAWMRAETGVGPCIASGSQVYRGICADLPVQPRNRNSVIAVTAALPSGNRLRAFANTSVKFRLPACWKIRNMATRNPKSPTRLTMNAFLPASALICSVNQNPIRR